MGQDTKKLIKQLRKILKLNVIHKAALVGVGNLGAAVMAYPGFKVYGFDIAAVFDNNPRKIGRRVENIAVEPGQTSLLDLLRALDNLSEGEIEPPTQRFQRRLLTITECIQTLERTFHTGELVSFRSVLGQKPTRAKIVSYFITILELISRGWISFHQAYPFAEIELKRTERWTVDS